MALHHPPNNTREHRRSNPSDVSESERSFVSAASVNNTSLSHPSNSESESPPPPPSSSSPQSHGPSDNSSASSNFEQPTPLVKSTLASPPAYTPKSTCSPGSYFSLQPSTPGTEPRSPQSRRAPASRSSHGIETRSGPPPALSTQRSYNADSPWRRLPPAEPTSPGIHKSGINGSIDSILTTGGQTFEASDSKMRKHIGGNRRSLDAVAARRKDLNLQEEDQDPTIQVNGGHRQSSSLELTQSRNPEDLFLNLARSDATTEGPSDSMSMVERRRVSDSTT